VSSRIFRIPIQQAGTMVVVQVRLNDQLTVPFYVDTGASDVVIPAAVAETLGIQIGPDTRAMVYGTANGAVRNFVVTLDSVDLGGARVQDVPASVSPSMGTGLLGLSFFNHFTYQIDTAHGVLTLQPNKLVEEGLIRGGRSEAQWRAEFQNLRAQIRMVDGPRDGDPTSTWSERVEARRSALEKQLDQLEEEADQAHVPESWRE
jgi:clan AA aspartic protease (TIGR02281 family)